MCLELDYPQGPVVSIEGAYAVAEARIESLKAAGLIRRVEEINDEWELDDHFDDLARVYRHTFRVLGLAWPPAQDEASGEGGEGEQ